MKAAISGNPSALCDQVASGQDGVLTHAQALACGMSAGAIQRRVTNGVWQPMWRGIYRVTAAPSTWRQRVHATSLWIGQTGALSHDTAAALLDLEGFTPGPLVVSSETNRRPPAGITLHRVKLLGPADKFVLNGLTVTTGPRTLLDIAGIHDRTAVERALDDALRRGLVSVAKMNWYLEGVAGKGQSGSATLRSLMQHRSPGYVAPESPLERRLWRLLRASDLPRPIRQYTIRNRSRTVARVDLAYPAEKIALEADGYRWHSGRQSWMRDLRRRNALTELGWRVVHVTHADLVERPGEVVRHVRTLLDESRLFPDSASR